jgi:hypothetical protein
VDRFAESLDEARVIGGGEVFRGGSLGTRVVRAHEQVAGEPLGCLHGPQHRAVGRAGDQLRVAVGTHLLHRVGDRQAGDDGAVTAAYGTHDPLDERRRDQRARGVVHQHDVVLGTRESEARGDGRLPGRPAVGHPDGDPHVRVTCDEVGHDADQAVRRGHHYRVHDARRREASRGVQHEWKAVQLHQSLRQVAP